MALHQRHAGHGDHHAPDVGTAVAGEDLAARVVPHQEAEGGADQADHHGRQLPVADLQRHVRDCQADQHGDRAREPVVAVDDVEGMRQAADRQGREEHGGIGNHRQPAVDRLEAGARHAQPQQPAHQQRRADGQPQPVAHLHALGDVLDDAAEHRGQDAHQREHRGRDRPGDVERVGAGDAGSQPGHAHAHQDARAAQARHVALVEALGHVGAVDAGMPPRTSHEHLDREGGDEETDDDQSNHVWGLGNPRIPGRN